MWGTAPPAHIPLQTRNKVTEVSTWGQGMRMDWGAHMGQGIHKGQVLTQGRSAHTGPGRSHKAGLSTWTTAQAHVSMQVQLTPGSAGGGVP